MLKNRSPRLPAASGALLGALLALGPWSAAAQTVVNLDSAWLQAHGPAPYQLVDSNVQYVLQTDVTTEGTAFLVKGTGSSLDLNGKTITYADLAFTGVENPGFEVAGSSADQPAAWDLSHAPHARRQDYSQVLFFDDYSLRLENPAGDALAEEYVLSGPVTLPAAGQYAALAEVKGGPYQSVVVRLEIEGVAVTCGKAVSNMGTTYSGTDMSIGIICEFAVTQPATVRAKVVLATQDPAITVTASVDEVDIRPIGQYGVARGDYNRGLKEVKNGRIVQGRSRAVYSHALSQVGAQSFHDLTLITNGTNCANLSDMWLGGTWIYNNHLEANGKLPLHRHYAFSMIDLSRTAGGNQIDHNTLLNGPHVGINHGNSGSEDNPERSAIHHNIIRTRIVATNGFAISAGSNLDIYDNTIQPFQGHGIGLGKGSNGVRIYGNLIEPRTWPCSEYATYGYPNAAHGIRIKTYGNGNLHDLEIFNNTILGKTNPQKANCYTEVVGITNYLTDHSTDEPNPHTISIHDNQIKVETDDYLHQHAIAHKAGEHGEFRGNVLESNHILVEMSDSDGGVARNCLLASNTLVKGANPSGFDTLRFGYNRPEGCLFLDTTVQSGADLKDLLQTRSYTPAADYSVGWTLTVHVRNLAGAAVYGASVVAYDKTATASPAQLTDGSGDVRLALKEYTGSLDSSVHFVERTPYTVEASRDGKTASQAAVTLSAPKEITLVLDVESVDAGVAGPDAATLTADSGGLTRPDAEVVTGPDAEVVTGPDAEVVTGPDAEVVSGPDAEVATGPDAEVVTGPDAGVVAGPDSGVIALADAGAQPWPDEEIAAGCGCGVGTAGQRASPVGALALAGLLAARRRRLRSGER